MCFQPFKSSIRIYQTFFKGINGNSRDEKEKQGCEEKSFPWNWEGKNNENDNSTWYAK
jgi:hypothetical protein